MPALGMERLAAAASVIAAYLTFCAVVYSAHRRKKSIAAQAAAPDGEAMLVAFASQTGFAEQVAGQTAESLRSAGMPVRVASLAQLNADSLGTTQRALFVVSTTGEGDAPDTVVGFVRKVLGAPADLKRLHYGVLALGDRGYQHYCAFGHALDTWLRHQGATPMFDLVEVDNADEGALRHWQHHLGILSGRTDLADWSAPAYGRWKLVERRHLNPSSPGGPAFHIALEPLDEPVSWHAGDIAEIGPCTAPGEPAAQQLPHREYSIASIPADGRLELLVRQMRRPDGRLGIGSGWLTEHAPLGGEIALRVRENRGFHPPEDDRPLILIGNGTGMAGLRAHLKARAEAGHGRNWLLFGERTRAHDFFYEDEIEAWHRSGVLDRIDLIFSRDRPERIYVQDRLREEARTLCDWVEAGAAIYVCGSLEGMSTGVAAVLVETLGEARLEQMAEEGRYRRDVY